MSETVAATVATTQVCLVSDGFFHPPFRARQVVRETLAAVPGCRLDRISHLNDLVGLDVSQVQALVLYYHHKRLQPEALRALDRFVQRGGGILAIHSASASFKDQPRYGEILGGHFTGHGPVDVFGVAPSVHGQDEVFDSAGAFTVNDELYLHTTRPDIRTHFFARYQDRPVPVVWTRRQGAGRVCYVGPGHRAATMKQAQMAEILRRGLLWVAR